MSLSSSLNYDAYQDHWDYYNNFSTMITSNDGKTVAGTFAGTLFTILADIVQFQKIIYSGIQQAGNVLVLFPCRKPGSFKICII